MAGIPQGKRMELPRIFVGREKALDLFNSVYQTAVSTPSDEDLVQFYLVNYYGMGGIGKTSLINQIIEEHFKNNDNKYFIRYDMEGTIDYSVILDSLKSQLIAKNSNIFKFPLYDEIIRLYTSFGDDIYSQKTVNVKVNEQDLIISTLDVIGHVIPQVGTAITVGRDVFSFIQKCTNRSLINLNDSSIRGDKKFFSQLLTQSFYADLNACTSKLDYPLTIFFDTFEVLERENSHSIGWLFDKNKGLLRNINNVIWVVAGREKLHLEQIFSDYPELIDEFEKSSLELDKLIEDEVISFLKYATIEEKFLPGIVKICDGNPLWLNVTLKYYESCKSPEKDFDISNIKSEDELMERYMMNMNDSWQDLVRQLAILGSWNLEIVKETLINVNYKIYGELINNSFINVVDNKMNYDTNEKTYYMHNLVRTVVFNFCKKENYPLLSDICKKVYNFYDNKLEISKVSDLLYTTYLEQLVEFIIYINDSTFSVAKLFNYISKCAITGKYEVVQSLVNKLYTYADRECHNNEYKINIKNNCIDFFLENDLFSIKSNESETFSFDDSENNESVIDENTNYELNYFIVQYAQNTYEMSENLFGKNNNNTLYAWENYARSIWKRGQLNKAVEEQEKLLYIRETRNDDITTKINSIMTLSSYYWKMGLQKKSCELIEKNYDPDLLIQNGLDIKVLLKIGNQLAVDYSIFGEYEKSNKLLIELLNNIYGNNLFEYDKFLDEIDSSNIDNLEGLRLYKTVARNLAKLEKDNEAYNLYKKIYAKLKMINNNEDSLETIEFLSIFASFEHKLGNNEVAYSLYKERYDFTKKMFGEDNLKTIESKAYLSDYMYNINRQNESYRLNKEILQSIKKILPLNHHRVIASEFKCAQDIWKQNSRIEAVNKIIEIKDNIEYNHPSNFRIASKIANQLFQMEYHEIGKKLYEKIIDEQSKGPEGYDVYIIQTKSRYAYSLLKYYKSKKSDLELARKLYEDILQTLCKNYGNNHSDTLDTKYNLANVLLKLDIDDETNKQAMRYKKEVYDTQCELFGEKDGRTIKTKVSFIIDLCNQGEFKNAIIEKKKILPIIEELKGPESIYTLDFKTKFAENYLFLDNSDCIYEAEKMILEVLDILERNLGDYNHYTLLAKEVYVRILDKKNVKPNCTFKLAIDILKGAFKNYSRESKEIRKYSKLVVSQYEKCEASDIDIETQQEINELYISKWGIKDAYTQRYCKKYALNLWRIGEKDKAINIYRNLYFGSDNRDMEYCLNTITEEIYDYIKEKCTDDTEFVLQCAITIVINNIKKREDDMNIGFCIKNKNILVNLKSLHKEFNFILNKLNIYSINLKKKARFSELCQINELIYNINISNFDGDSEEVKKSKYYLNKAQENLFELISKAKTK